MKTKWITLTMSLFYLSLLSAQENPICIDICQERARENYPLIRQHGLINLSQAYNLSTISTGYLPQVSLNGQATYQSDVVHLPISLPGINVPSMDKDQYKATLDVTQTIWDGGNISSQRKIVQSNKDIDRQTLEVQLYTIRERINQLYFGILMIREQLNQLYLLREDLQNGLKTVQAFSQNGTATQSDIDAVQVELLNVEQRETELHSLNRAYIQMLSAMTNTELGEDTPLEKPSEDIVNLHASINRPELELYEKQRSLFDAQESLITAKNMPRLSLFLQGGYGKPGLNMLSDQFDLFGIAGVRLSWNFGNLYSTKNEKRLIETNKNMVNTLQETFLFNTNLQLKQLYNDILKAKELITKDDEIIALRKRVKAASESKYENGIYTINDLLKDINAENQSKQAKVLHEMLYLMNIYSYKNITGN